MSNASTPNDLGASGKLRGMSRCAVIESDPEILGGTPVFAGTRVPVETLFEYLEGGRPLAEFLEDFPTVGREQAVELLEHLKQLAVGQVAAAARFSRTLDKLAVLEPLLTQEVIDAEIAAYRAERARGR